MTLEKVASVILKGSSLFLIYFVILDSLTLPPHFTEDKERKDTGHRFRRISEPKKTK